MRQEVDDPVVRNTNTTENTSVNSGSADKASRSLDWTAYLGIDINSIRSKFSRSAFFPVVTILGLIGLIYNTGQLRSLAISLTSPLGLQNDVYSGGFGASIVDLVLWLASCGMVAWSWFLFLVAPVKRSATQLPLGEIALIHLAFPFLVLSPFFLSCITFWHPIIALFLLSAVPFYLIVERLNGWRASAVFLSTGLSIDCLLHVTYATETFFVAVTVLFTLAVVGVYFSRYRNLSIHTVLGAIICIVAVMTSVLAANQARPLLSISPADQATFDPRGLLLALWWLMPGIMVNAISRVPQDWLRGASAWTILFIGLIFFVWIAVHPASVFGLTTLSVAAAIVLATGSLLRASRIRLYRHVAAYATLVLVCIACWGLAPTPVAGPLPKAQRLGSARPSGFDAFYRRWLALRGESRQHHGPILLVAVAGGGVRAAAHATLSMALADDIFKGKFGDRTLAISAVSGGALGAAVWLGQRTEQLPLTDVPAGFSRTATQLSRFYQHDFVSPTLNRLLAHDLPYGSMPGLQSSDRDQVLAATWTSSWDTLRFETHAAAVNQTIFQRRFDSLGADDRLPIVIFNTTSAADGRPALYSSVAGKFPGAWMLDASVPVMKAVIDSARFAVISPVGHRCAQREAALPLHSETTPVICPTGYDPIAVADGGYSDNSGIGSLETILDELAQDDSQLTNVYLVVIRSNPEIGLNLQEGKRFDMGRAVPELLAPFAVMETARGARSDLAAERWERYLGIEKVITWDLHSAQLASRKTAATDGPYHFAWFDNKYNNAEDLRRLGIAPLGWTLDRQSFRALHFDTMTTPTVPVASTCENLLPAYTALCRILPTANSPRHQ